MTEEVLLEAKDIVFDYDGAPALAGVDLRIERGVNLAVMGPNGSGKSTLFLLLNGSFAPKEGQLFLKSSPMGTSRGERAALRKHVGLVFQNPDDQLFAATVRQDISFGPLNMGMDDSSARQAVESALEAMGIADLADRPTHQMSFGQKKRVVLAGVIAMSPEVLLLDEPTAGLDAQGARDLSSTLERLKQSGTTLVIATHDADFAWEWADKTAIMNRGRVETAGETTTVLGGAALPGLSRPVLSETYGLLVDRRILDGSMPPPRSLGELAGRLDARGVRPA